MLKLAVMSVSHCGLLMIHILEFTISIFQDSISVCDFRDIALLDL